MLRTLLLATMLSVSAHAATRTRHIHVESSISVLGPVSFVDHSASLTADAQRTLDAVATTLIGNPELRVEVQCTQDADLTPTVAQHRAAAVRAYLDTHGVDGRRLATRVVTDGDGIRFILL